MMFARSVRTSLVEFLINVAKHCSKQNAPACAAPQTGMPSLPDEVRHESASKAHHKDGCGYHDYQVNGPWVVAFAHKVEVFGAVFVSIYVEVHSSALRLRCEHVSRIPPLEAH